MKTTGLIAIVFGYHKKSQQTLGLSTGNFVKKNSIIGRSESEWRKILYRIGDRIGHFFGIGTPLLFLRRTKKYAMGILYNFWAIFMHRTKITNNNI